MTDAEFVALLYRCLLGREPDREGLAYSLARIAECGDLRPIISSIVASAEYQSREPAPCEPMKLASLLRRPLTIVDVGAQELANQDHIYGTLLRSDLPLSCIGFEPLHHRIIERIEDGDSRVTMLPDYVGDGSAQTFHINNIDATSSLLPLNIDFNSAFAGLCNLRSVATEHVTTSRLDDLLAGLEVVDFLKLDIQGFELAALQGATEVLKRCNVIHCEVEFAPIYLGQPLFSEVESFLRPSGFDFIDFVSLARYAYASVPEPSNQLERLCWADAVFFRDLRRTGGSWDDAVAQATIASHLYGKCGLAKKILIDAEQMDAVAVAGLHPNPSAIQGGAI